MPKGIGYDGYNMPTREKMRTKKQKVNREPKQANMGYKGSPNTGKMAFAGKPKVGMSRQHNMEPMAQAADMRMKGVRPTKRHTVVEDNSKY